MEKRNVATSHRERDNRSLDAAIAATAKSIAGANEAIKKASSITKDLVKNMKEMNAALQQLDEQEDEAFFKKD